MSFCCLSYRGISFLSLSSNWCAFNDTIWVSSQRDRSPSQRMTAETLFDSLFEIQKFHLFKNNIDGQDTWFTVWMFIQENHLAKVNTWCPFSSIAMERERNNPDHNSIIRFRVESFYNWHRHVRRTQIRNPLEIRFRFWVDIFPMNSAFSGNLFVFGVLCVLVECSNPKYVTHNRFVIFHYH